jgi:hypothetical protein
MSQKRSSLGTNDLVAACDLYLLTKLTYLIFLPSVYIFDATGFRKVPKSLLRGK